ncbi:MAG: histidine--tRNA ligase [Actinobacteria bacterium]|uniref:histidine--tRNA ligase n=1 Tax=freshwater metagenome TaxID=449393 RepID=A0A6J6PFD4_9ZZZZ|nr:histidine--tRNA ligase [Actinomycetota bacterium]
MARPAFQAPKGVAEYLPPDSADFLAVREGLSAPAIRSGYLYAEVPVFEDTALFTRGVGESTDVVSKEMYTFDDRGGRSRSLRPEGTVGVIRATIEHGLDRGQLPVKLWYAGPCFRAERPQQGRYRQFFQMGIEAIGSDDPALDAEVISVAYRGYQELGIKQFRLDLTSLGDKNCRPQYRALLVAFLADLPLDEATRKRAEINPLRVLDDKRAEMIELLKNAPLMKDHLCKECADHFAAVCQHLDDLKIEYTIAPRMVRGLDYYTRTTFEFIHPLLGAQSGIGGGGRYDGLMAELGGQDLSGIGFGLGIDRTLLAIRAEAGTFKTSGLDLYIVPMGDLARRKALIVADSLRSAGLRVDLSFGDRGLKGAMKAADKSGAEFSLVIGESELTSGALQLKEMSTGELIPATMENLSELLLARRS